MRLGGSNNRVKGEHDPSLSLSFPKITFEFQNISTFFRTKN